MATFYHLCCSKRFSINQIIDGTPNVNENFSLLGETFSNYGETLLGSPIISPNPKMTISQIRNYFSEWIRQNEFPSRPSRLNCLFCVKQIEQLKPWSKILKVKKDSLIYTVESDSFFEADAKLLDAPNNLSDLLFNLRQYWKGEFTNAPRLEVLLSFPVHIVDIMDACDILKL